MTTTIFLTSQGPLRCQLKCANEMLSAMPTTSPFPSILAIRSNQPFVKMKPEPFCSPFLNESETNSPTEPSELEELLETIDLTENDNNSMEWPNSKRASQHLSGGGLLADFSNIFDAGISSNPFKNHINAALGDNDEDLTCPSSTNPFSIFAKSSPKSSSQCSTRPASPTCNNPFLQQPVTSHQSTQTGNESSLAPWLLSHQSEDDLMCLQRTLTHLRVCGWYYENVSWQDSIILLRDSEPGTFLIRDSLDPNFLFSLSVQTTRGPTSVRLHYVKGKFRLDAEQKLVPSMPSFETVIDLIDYYVEFTGDRNKHKHKCKSKEQVWIDSLGQVYSHILLSKPLYKKDFFPSLKHLARLEYNKSLRRHYIKKYNNNNSNNNNNNNMNNLKEVNPYVPMINIIKSLLLPQSLLEYLLMYPFSH